MSIFRSAPARGAFFGLRVITSVLACSSILAAVSPLSPAQALASFQLEHPGLRVELVAGEPLVVDPVAMAFDEHGRLYVVENRDYPTGSKPGAKPSGAVALLQDTNGDGMFETRINFVEELTFPNGIMPWDGGVFVTCAPDLFYFKDTNGDGKADVRKVVLTGFSTNSTTQLRVSHPTLSLDGWIYLTSGLGTGGKVFRPDQPNEPAVEYKTDCRFNPITAKFEPTEARAQFGLTFDQAGHRFICMNRVHVQHVVMPSRYLKRNPHLVVADAVQNCPEEMAPEPLKGHGAAARIYPITEQVTTADSHEGTFTAACGVFVYGGDALPAYRGNVFACEPTANLVHRDELIPNGSTFAARPSRSRAEFFASTDNWFRPVFLTSGPDGALYICDMYRKTIEHPEYLPQEVRKGTDFESGKGMGRIYRVTAESARARKPRLAKSSVRALCRELSAENSWTSFTAFRLLLERCHNNTSNRAAAIPVLKRAFSKRRTGILPVSHPALPHLRLLDLFGALNEPDLTRALSHKDSAVREHALQIAETRLPASNKLLAAVMKLSADPAPRVRMQCALTLGASHEDVVIPPLSGIAIRDAHDTWTRLAVISSSAGREGLLLNTLLAAAAVELQSKPYRQSFDTDSSDEATISGLLSLCYELGRITGITSSKRSWTMNEIGRDQILAELQMSTLAGIGDSLRARVADPTRTSLLEEFTHTFQPRLPRARSICTNAEVNSTLRQHAISLLTFGNYGDNRDALLRLLAPTEPTPLQLTAVRSLARFSDPQVVPDLLGPERWHVYTPVVRDAVLNVLVSDAKHLPGALGALEAGTIPVSAVDSTRRKQLTSHKDPAIRSRAEALFNLAGGSPLSSRVKVFEEWKSVLGLTPSPQNGRAIFKQHCGACHRLDREGVNVGPDLFGIRNQPKEVILLHIIIPEQEIAPGFTAYDVVTRDERTVTGLIVADTPEAVTIRSGLGLEETISRSNIASLTSQNLSLMPQELEKNTTRQDMADLLAFLKGEQPGK